MISNILQNKSVSVGKVSLSELPRASLVVRMGREHHFIGTPRVHSCTIFVLVGGQRQTVGTVLGLHVSTVSVYIRYAIEPHGIPVRMTRLPHSKLLYTAVYTAVYAAEGQVLRKPKLTHP